MITIKIHTRGGQALRPVAEPAPDLTAADKWSELVLRRRLGVLLTVLLVVQFLGWLPHYLTWPWWSDHDVFATLALGWDHGVLPYRDARCNNFPGSIYVFWLLGHTVGWGWTPAFNALDAALLVGLGVLFVSWSRRRLGGPLPGVAGFAAVATYYFNLNYSLAGQRDWHGPCLAVAALLIVDGWPGRAGRWLSAVGLAFAFAFRPQVVLLVPAFLVALDDGRRRAAEEQGTTNLFAHTLATIAEWALALALGLAVAFLPLVLSGLMGDFLASLRRLAYGGTYNRNNVGTVLQRLVKQFMPVASWSVPVVVALLASRSQPKLARLARTLLAAYVLIALYKPLSPIPAPYLDTPIRLIWSLELALAVAMVLDLTAVAPALRLAMVLGLLPIGISTQPLFCSSSGTLTALREWGGRTEPVHAPPGYVHFYLRTPYPWKDYREVLAYLRAHTSPTTRVANALKHDPAITGPAGRLSAFTAESLAWLRLVNPGDEPRFVSSLEQADDSVVVWSPEETRNRETPQARLLFAAIARLYAPEARFGVIEVWRRKPETALASRAPAHVE